MNSIKTTNRIHPLMAAAAIAVIALSGLGIAAITGVLPSSHGTATPAANIATATGTPTVTGEPIAVGNLPPNLPSPPPLPANGIPPVPPMIANEAAPVCLSCGTIESVQTVQHQAKPTGVGAVAGALLGGVIGNRFGGGNGRVLTTVGGAVGGGLAGNEIEKRTHTSSSYLAHVRMANGKLRTFPYATQPGWHIGDHVRVIDGKLLAGS